MLILHCECDSIPESPNWIGHAQMNRPCYDYAIPINEYPYA